MPMTKKKQLTVKKPPTSSSTNDKRRSPRTPTTTSSATRNKPKRVTTRGGELLGQGAYGCAFSPQIPCSLDHPILKGDVSKLMTSYNANDEAGKASLATNMDPEGKYLLPFVGMCDTDAELVTNYLAKNPGNICKSLNTVLSNKPHLLVYKHKGIDLEKYLELAELMPLKEMVKHLLNVAEGIQLLQNDPNQSAHTDIKPDNVLLVDLEDGEKRMLLMDFGLLEDLDTVYENDLKLKHDSEHYPPELLVYYVFKRMETPPKADELYDWLFSKNANYTSDNKKGLHYRKRNGKWIKWIDEYQNKLEAFFTTLYKFMETDKGNDKEKAKNLEKHFFANFAKKMDVFQFGFVLQEVAKTYDPDDVMYEFEEGDNDRLYDLKNIVMNTYHPNPYARWDIAQVIAELKKKVKNSYSTVAKKPHSPSLSSPAATKEPPSQGEGVTVAATPKRSMNKGKPYFMNNNSLNIIKDSIITNSIIANKKRPAQTAGNKGANTVGSKKPTTKRTPTTSARAAVTKKKLSVL